MGAIHLADPGLMTTALMQDGCAGFDNWALRDTATFHLFDKTAARWGVAQRWCAATPLYIWRSGLAMIWALSAHDKPAPDAAVLAALGWIATTATDPRRHVHTAASMALRATGKRNAALHPAALDLCDHRAAHPDRTARAQGRTCARELRGAGIRVRDQTADPCLGRKIPAIGVSCMCKLLSLGPGRRGCFVPGRPGRGR